MGGRNGECRNGVSRGWCEAIPWCAWLCRWCCRCGWFAATIAALTFGRWKAPAVTAVGDGTLMGISWGWCWCECCWWCSKDCADSCWAEPVGDGCGCPTPFTPNVWEWAAPIPLRLLPATPPPSVKEGRLVVRRDAVGCIVVARLVVWTWSWCGWPLPWCRWCWNWCWLWPPPERWAAAGWACSCWKCWWLTPACCSCCSGRPNECGCSMGCGVLERRGVGVLDNKGDGDGPMSVSWWCCAGCGSMGGWLTRVPFLKAAVVMSIRFLASCSSQFW